MVKHVSVKGLEWFQNVRYGMFIHWGLYAILGIQEWVMHTNAIPVPEYEKLVQQFNPVKFNAEEWVSIAADAGMKYMVITSRHHDGFSMYDTQLSDYKVTNTPFKRDPIAELATAIAKRGDMKLGFYSSLLDWHHPAYRFRAESGLAWSDYIEFLHGQVRELCTNFGDLACLWFDGDWPRHPFNEKNAYFKAGGSFEYEALYDMIHTLQPDTVVMNNHHEMPLPGEDVQGFEKDLPGQNTMSFNTTAISDLPREVCMTLNDHWGYCATDDNHKSARYLVNLLARSASVNANFLLNVGPTAEGEILPVHAERLREAGQWVQVHGDSIYNTRASNIGTSQGVVATQRDTTLYAHVLDYISDCVTLKGLPDNITNARLLRDGTPLTIQKRGDELLIPVPIHARNPFNTVIELS
jgi:alpha-L-fucosidase